MWPSQNIWTLHLWLMISTFRFTFCFDSSEAFIHWISGFTLILLIRRELVWDLKYYISTKATSCLGAFFNYVYKNFFDLLPSYVDIFYIIRVDKKLTLWSKYLTYYLLSHLVNVVKEWQLIAKEKIYDIIPKSKDGIVWICWTESKVGIAKLFVFELMTNKIVVKIISNLQNGKKLNYTIKGSCFIKHFIEFGRKGGS